jgi:hypothetical protein
MVGYWSFLNLMRNRGNGRKMIKNRTSVQQNYRLDYLIVQVEDGKIHISISIGIKVITLSELID